MGDEGKCVHWDRKLSMSDKRYHCEYVYVQAKPRNSTWSRSINTFAIRNGLMSVNNSNDHYRIHYKVPRE